MHSFLIYLDPSSAVLHVDIRHLEMEGETMKGFAFSSPTSR